MAGLNNQVHGELDLRIGCVGNSTKFRWLAESIDLFPEARGDFRVFPNDRSQSFADYRSLAGPEPGRQVFAKFEHLLRKAAAPSPETIYLTIGDPPAFAPTECADYFRNSGYAQSIML